MAKKEVKENKKKASVKDAQTGEAVKPPKKARPKPKPEPILKAKIEAKIFREVFGAVGSVLDEVPIEITAEGMNIQCMNTSHVALLIGDMKKEMFDEYEFTKAETIGLDTDRVNTMLNRVKPSDILEIEIREEKMLLRMIGETKRTFSIDLLATLENKSKIPEIPSTATIKISAETIKDGIKDAGIVGDHITFECKKDRLFLLKAGDSDFTMTVGNGCIKDYDLKEECKSCFDLDLLKNIVKHWNEDITLKFGEDLPIVVDFDVNKASFQYILAPRIERE